MKDNALKKPTLLRRVWKVWAYNIFWTIILYSAFKALYTIDDVCYELDLFLMYGDLFRKDLICSVGLFWMCFRQFFKNLNLIRFTYLTSKHDKEIIEKGGAKRMYEGVEGSGKTLNTANETLYLACEKDREMRLKYYLQYPFREQLSNDIDFNVLQDSFNFYEDNPEKIPHLMSNFKMTYQGRENYPFSMQYFDKVKRPAEGFAVGITEIGNDLPNSMSKMPADTKNDKLHRAEKVEMFSLSRQYLNMHIVADEQRSGEVFLGFRALAATNYRIIERIKCLKPTFLMFILNLLEDLILWLKKKNKAFLTTFYKQLEDLIQDIGFYLFIIRERDVETGKKEKENLSFVVSCDLPYDFDTRGERYKYTLYGNKPQ